MLWAPLLISTLVAPSPVRDPLAPYRGLPIVTVDVEAPASEHEDELRRLIAIEPGYLLSQSAIDTALKRLYALGRFADVAVYAERLSGSIILHFRLRAAQRLEVVEIPLLRHVSADGLRAALGVAPGSEVDRRTPGQIAERAFAYLARSGFPQAKVTVAERRGELVDSVIYSLDIIQGEPRRIRDITFRGSPRVEAHVLRSICMSRAGGILDEAELGRDRERLVAAYQEHGFPNVRVTKPDVTGDARFGDVQFEIEAGDRVAILLRENHLFASETLFALWPHPKSTLQPEDLPAFCERIEEAYRRVGYANAHASVRGLRDQSAGTVRYILTIQEGEPSYVTEISFAGATVFPPDLLVEQVRTVLVQELSEKTVFLPLLGVDTQAAGVRATGMPVPPAEQRWVPELYQQAIDQIVAAYHNRGYLAAAVGPIAIEVSGHRVKVRVPVNEGPQTFVRAVSFSNNTAVPSPELLALLEESEQRSAASRKETDAGQGGVVPGRPLSRNAVEDARISIVRRYRDDGYLYAVVTSEVRLAEPGLADLSFRIEEGPQVRIENVLVRGNRYTQGRIIESRMAQKSGDLYRLEQALQDQRDIASLGVFSSVRVRLIDEETPAERKDVVADVVERNRQAVEIWPGLSTADGPRLRVDYSHLNLGGTATNMTLSLKVNWKVFFGFYGDYAEQLEDRFNDFSIRERTEIQARAGVRSPRLLELPLDPVLRFDLLYERDNAIPYSLDAGRAIFGLELTPRPRWTITIEPQFTLTNLRCFETTAIGTEACEGKSLERHSDSSRIDEGLRGAFKVVPSITYEGRDDPFNPRNGLYANVRAVWERGSTLSAEVLTSAERIRDEDWQPFAFSKLEGTLSGYISLGQRSVLALTGRGGMVLHGEVPIDERFYLGGSTSLRAFQEDALLADDLCVVQTSADNPNVPQGCIGVEPGKLPVSGGGNYYALAKTELRLSLSERSTLALFLDAGDLWLNSPGLSSVVLRLNPGVGLRYATPAGPLGLDVGINPDPDPLRGESRFAVQFAVGVF